MSNLKRKQPSLSTTASESNANPSPSDGDPSATKKLRSTPAASSPVRTSSRPTPTTNRKRIEAVNAEEETLLQQMFVQGIVQLCQNLKLKKEIFDKIRTKLYGPASSRNLGRDDDQSTSSSSTQSDESDANLNSEPPLLQPDHLNSQLARVDKPHYYMSLALSAALRSMDPKTQVGCVIADVDGAILGVGYNAMPYGTQSDDAWSEKKKGLRVVHAEANALLHVSNRDRLKGAHAYVTLFPCASCAALLIQAKISQITYLSYRLDRPHCTKSSVAGTGITSDAAASTTTASSSSSASSCAPDCSCMGEDTYKVSKELLDNAKIEYSPFFPVYQNYDLLKNQRLTLIWYHFEQQLTLLSVLKQRELKLGYTEAWPETIKQEQLENDSQSDSPTQESTQ